MTTGYKFKRKKSKTLLLACGALAKEIVDIIEHNHLDSMDVQCISAQLHHRPALIPQAIEAQIIKNRDNYQKIYVIYGDCGTAGELDKVLDKYAVERIDGPHCFAFYEGNQRFLSNEDDMTSFFLTDFFCRNFDQFIWQEYGLDKHESMTEFVFGNYKKIVYVAQTQNAELKSKAMAIAQRLGLAFEYRYRGNSDLGIFIENL